MAMEPIIFSESSSVGPKTARGESFIIHEWRGSGPDYLHVHYEDDEAWHVLEGILYFKFPGSSIEVNEGTTILVPAGLPHTYSASATARYLIILTPGLDALIAELQKAPYSTHADIMKKYKSEIINP